MIVTENYIDINTINFDISIETCLENLRPHPKFSGCTFDNYIPDERFSSQTMIKNLLIDKMMRLKEYSTQPKKRFSLFGKKNNGPERPKNLYIDGTYGIGKTHLLSSCYNACIKKKAFMSFTEMNFFIHYIGINDCIKYFGELDLLLIDEFDLNDPATTRIMAKFFTEISDKTLIITTSNTLPSELGSRIDPERFKKEMGIIAAAFRTVIVEGEDYRKRMKAWQNVISDDNFLDAFRHFEGKKPKTLTNFKNFMGILNNNHPFKYFVLPDSCEAIFVDDLKPFTNLNDAVRFAHFMDHCYYYNTKLFIKSDIGASQLFTKEMFETSFEKHLLRCLSRLEEIGVFFNK